MKCTNKKLGMVDMWQNKFYDGRKAGSSFNYNIPFQDLMESYKIPSLLCNDTDKIDLYLDILINYKESLFLEFLVEPVSNLPFVPSNTSIDKMIISNEIYDTIQ